MSIKTKELKELFKGIHHFNSFFVFLFLQTEKDANCLEPWLIKEMDSCLSDIWLHKDIDSFAQVFHLILTENVSGKLLLLILFLKKKTTIKWLDFLWFCYLNSQMLFLNTDAYSKKMNMSSRVNQLCTYLLSCSFWSIDIYVIIVLETF